MAKYVPDRGDVVWIDLNPQMGHEQAGKRSALVLSPKTYNAQVGLMLCCPIMTKTKGYPFEVSITAVDQPGVVLSDQIKSVDWRVRNVKKAGTAQRALVRDVIAKIQTLLPV